MNWDWYVKTMPVLARYKDAGFDKIDLPTQTKGELRSFNHESNSVLLYGSCGSGKTYAMHCMMRSVIERYQVGSMAYYNMKRLDDEILKTYYEYKSYESVISYLCRIPFLFLDDLGTDRASERMVRDVYDIIDYRWADMKPTVITTNLSAAMIKEIYGEKILSRLKSYDKYEFPDRDYRIVKM